MILYLDTSLVVAAIAREDATSRVQAWLAHQSADVLLISDWVLTELASALSMKIRTGDIDLEHRARMVAVFTQLRQSSMEVAPVLHEHFITATQYADQFSLGLRAADALHVAIAADHGATLCTLDRRLAQAATTLAVRAELV